MASPFISLAPPSATAAGADLPYFAEWDYDFDHDRFKVNADGTLKVAEGNDGIRVWVVKALLTERGRYLAYRHGDQGLDCDYGCELERFIGKRANDGASAALISAYIKSGLLVNPYIRSVDSVDVESRVGDHLALAVTYTTLYGSDDVRVVV